MVLIDAEGNKIQASAMNKSLHYKFCQNIHEGRTYFFANFVVSSNVNQYRSTNHPFKITFTPFTHIAEEHAEIPLYSYSFLKLSDILDYDGTKQTTFLIDLLAFVKSMGTLDEFRRDDETKHRLRMVLTDSQQNDLECVLFGQCASDAYMAQLQNVQTPVVILLNLARIGCTEDGRPQVSSSFNATSVLFNPPIKEVEEFIESAKDGSSPVMTTYSQPMPSQTSQVLGGNSLHSQDKITISQIFEQSIGAGFVINCQIVKLETRYGWNYIGCTKCGTKPKSDDQNEWNGSLPCPGCKKKPHTVEPK